ncbi:MAG: transposase [Nitrospinae bacterium]|nr:transposase [Nitrospinota bacterium]
MIKPCCIFYPLSEDVIIKFFGKIIKGAAFKTFCCGFSIINHTHHDTFYIRSFSKPPTRVIFDLDSTVLVLYGKQEMARIGYNPTKRGRPSYHPLLCFNLFV